MLTILLDYDYTSVTGINIHRNDMILIETDQVHDFMEIIFSVIWGHVFKIPL